VPPLLRGAASPLEVPPLLRGAASATPRWSSGDGASAPPPSPTTTTTTIICIVIVVNGRHQLACDALLDGEKLGDKLLIFGVSLPQLGPQLIQLYCARCHLLHEHLAAIHAPLLRQWDKAETKT
jgi:hypothetical protein